MESTPNSPIELSIVVLCYRTENLIIPFVAQLQNELKQVGIENYELVLVANYHKSMEDSTPKIVQDLALKDKRILAIAKEKRGMMGWDMRSGLDAATGNYIAVIDGDGQMPVSDIPIVYNIIKTGNHDLVKTFRGKRYDGLMRKTLSYGYNVLFKLFFRVPFPVLDINSKPKIFTKSAYQKMNLESNDWFTDSEIMLEAHRNELKVCQVSTEFFKNDRPSFIKPMTILEFIYNFFYYRIKYSKIKKSYKSID